MIRSLTGVIQNQLAARDLLEKEFVELLELRQRVAQAEAALEAKPQPRLVRKAGIAFASPLL
jgi:hypothetical protein